MTGQLVYIEKAFALEPVEKAAQEKRIADKNAQLVYKASAQAAHSKAYENELTDGVGTAVVAALHGETVRKADGPTHEHEHSHLSSYGYSYSHSHSHDHRDGITPDSKSHDSSEVARAHQHVSKADAVAFDEAFQVAMKRDAQPVRKAESDRYGVDSTDSQRYRYGQFG